MYVKLDRKEKSFEGLFLSRKNEGQFANRPYSPIMIVDF
jgi:hypothetical protein